MGMLLVIHLGVVAGFFLTAPYGKFAHVVYRYAALVSVLHRAAAKLEVIQPLFFTSSSLLRLTKACATTVLAHRCLTFLPGEIMNQVGCSE